MVVARSRVRNGEVEGLAKTNSSKVPHLHQVWADEREESRVEKTDGLQRWTASLRAKEEVVWLPPLRCISQPEPPPLASLPRRLLLGRERAISVSRGRQGGRRATHQRKRQSQPWRAEQPWPPRPESSDRPWIHGRTPVSRKPRCRRWWRHVTP
jgi:hypothetical protein